MIPRRLCYFENLSLSNRTVAEGGEKELVILALLLFLLPYVLMTAGTSLVLFGVIGLAVRRKRPPQTSSQAGDERSSASSVRAASEARRQQSLDR